jgi:hypothetical protein
VITFVSVKKEPKLYTLPPPQERERERQKKGKNTYSRVNSIQKEKYHFWGFTQTT